jgi:tetratricopeptide (TPR) repeat protein
MAIATEPGSTSALIALGDLYQVQGDVVKARLAYQRVISLTPGVATGYLRLANLALLQGNLEEAWRQFETAYTVEPASADVLVRLAQARSSCGDWLRAEAAYRQAIALSPLTTRAYVGLATLLQRRSEGLGSALDLLSQAQQLGVNTGMLYRAIGDLYREYLQSGQAAGYYQQAIRLEPASPGGYLGLSDLYRAEGLPWEAERYARLSLEVAPRDALSHIALGDAYQSLGDISAAERDYRFAINLDATRPDGYLALAGLYEAQGRYGEAIPAYQQAIGLSPFDWSLWISLSDAYAAVGQYDDAISALAQAANVNPSVPDPWLRTGDIYLIKGNKDNALASYERARLLYSGEAEPLLRLSSLFKSWGDIDRAERYAREAIAVEPLDSAGYAALGRILEDKGEIGEAIDSYMAAIQRGPRQTVYYKDWIRLHLDLWRGRLNTSLLEAALAEIANSPNSETLWAHILLGLGYLRVDGAMEHAISHLEKANALDPVHAELYRELAQAHELRSEGRRARTFWRRYLYAARSGSDTHLARAHLDWLMQTRIEQPIDGTHVSGSVEIVGTATGEDFQFYKLEFSPVGSPDIWYAVGEPVRQPVEHGHLMTWSTAGLASGDYRLRLIVVNATGNNGPYDEILLSVRGK